MPLDSLHQIKLIALDVDGTILNSSHSLSDGTKNTLHRMQDNGFHITLATGKILPSIKEISDQLEIKIPLILGNGAVLQDTNGRILWSSFLLSSHVEDILKIINHNADIALYTVSDIFVFELNHNISLISEYGECITDKIKDAAHLHQVIHKRISKILLINRLDSLRLVKLEDKIQATLGNEVNIARSLPAVLEITSKGAAKSKAIVALAKHLHIELKNIMAIGDSYNDIDLFRVSGISIAMGNAPEGIKRVADLTIGTNDEDGVATFLTSRFL